MDMFPFRYGFAPELWRKIIDVMIEKIAGRPYIHKLHLIAIVENQFNCALRQLWKYDIMPRAERLGLVGDGQKGGRGGFQTYDCLLLQRLSFELINVTYEAAIMKDFDASGCYDRIIKAIGGIFARRAGATKNIVRCSCLVKRDPKHHVKTAHGISDESFQGGPTDEQDGEGQGIVNAGENWNLMSSSLFKTLNEGAFGLDFTNVQRSITVKSAIKGYIDDSVGGTISRHRPTSRLIPDLTEISQLKADSMHTGQSWEKLLHWSGGTLEPPKSRIWVMYPMWDNGHHRLMNLPEIQEHFGKYTITSSETGEVHTIKILDPDKTGKNLGVLVCPTCNATPEFERRRDQSTELAGRLLARPVSRFQAYKIYTTMWAPAITYPLPVTFFTADQCHKIASPFLQQALPQQGFVRSIERSVVHGPLRYGGHDLVKLYTEQGIGAIKLLIGHLCAEGEVSEYILILLSYLQLHAGTSYHYLESCPRYMPHVPETWLGCLRAFLATFHGTIKIQDAWMPQKQRQNDTFIMDDVLAK